MSLQRSFTQSPWVKQTGYWRAHSEDFKNHPPTTTMVELKPLIDPNMLIEIETDAYVGHA